MALLIDQLTAWLQSAGLISEQAQWMARSLSVGVMVFLAVAANWVAKHLILRAVTSMAKHSSATWDDILVDTGVFTRLSHLAPALVLDAVGPDVLGHNEAALTFLDNATSIYLIIIAVMVLHAVLKAVRLILGQTTRGAQIPIKGFTQAIMLLATLVAGVFILGTLMGKSPVYFLSGIGALTAIIILVFKDAIMGFVAGIQISVNQLVRVGDWIEMPKNGADGDVIDVSLTTVKVRNWDKTITTIPTYSLISDSFKNWRGMSESGGRRIKRSLLIDMQTVGFADEKLLEHWKHFSLLKPYLDEKLGEIAKENAARGEDLGELGVGRRLTNLGTFRAYCVAYLHAHPRIHQDMTFLVRQLQPTASGLPLEIYVFTNDIRWDVYEGIQSDIFDHLLAIIGQFNLRVFQTPSGHDVGTALTALRGEELAASLSKTS
jgi:miniconductance mechanosensitive channel